MEMKLSQKQQNTRSSSGISQQIGFQQQKRRKFFIKQSIYGIYFLARIALSVSILVVLHQNFIQQLFDTDPYKRMAQNIGLWKLDVITNITTVNSYNCPQGFQTYTSYEWPGTKQGCYCYVELGEWDYIKVLQGPCSQLAIGARCTKVLKKSAIPFLFWKKNELICLKRIKNLNFFADLQKLKIPYTKCSQTKESRFDIPNVLQQTQCPITQIQNDSSLSQKIEQINFSFSRQDQYPVVAVKMAEYQFCPDFSKQNISPSKQRETNYNLENKVRSACQGIDARVLLIDEIGQDQLFRNNPRIEDVIRQLPAYPQPMSDYRYKLGYMRYPQWKHSCRKSSQFGLFKTQSYLDLNQISSYAHVCTSIITAFSVLFGLFFTAFYLYRKVVQLFYKSQHKVLYDILNQLQRKKPNLYEKIHKRFKTQLIIFIVKVLFGLTALIALVVFFQQVKGYFTWYKQARKCTSEIMKEWIQLGYIKYFQSQQKKLLVCIILLLSLMIIDAVMFLWRNFKGDLKKQQFDQEMTNIFDGEANQKQLSHKSCQSQQIFQKDLELGQLKLGKIRKNNTANDEILITENNLIYQPKNNPTIIVRPKKQTKRKKMMQSSDISEFTQQWEI